MNLYIASSWKNEKAVLALAKVLREHGFQVDAFCEADPPRRRTVFRWSELVSDPAELARYDAKTFLEEPKVQSAFQEDMRWLNWAQGVVLLVPSGRSAHLEAGYAVGHGKYLWIYGELPKGEFDVMYRMAYGIYRINELQTMISAIQVADEAINAVNEALQGEW